MAVSPEGGDRADSDASSSRRWLLAAIAGAGLLFLAAGLVVGFVFRGSSNGSRLLATAIGGPFHLEDQDGKTVTAADIKGRWELVYFGYTHCPDACPMALNNMALALDKLGSEKKQVGLVFVTVDPQRDTPAALKSYVSSFDAPIVALTGTPAEIAEAAKSYRVYYARHDLDGGDYSMDHSSIIYVMNPQGRFTASFTQDNSPDEIATRLKKLLS